MGVDDNAREAEKHILSAMMVNAKAIPEVQSIIEPGDFYEPRHELIARCIFGLYKDGKPIDPVSLTECLNADGALRLAGGVEYLHDLHGFTPTWVNAGYYADIVHEAGRRRLVAAVGTQIEQLAADASNSPDAVIEAARQALAKAAGAQRAESAASDDVAAQVIANIGRSSPAVPTPWASLTSQIKGFRPGALYIIGARPGIGKSALALQCAHMLERRGTVAYFTLEMGKEEVVARLISQETEVAHTMIDGEHSLPPWAQVRVESWLAAYRGAIRFDDRGTLTVGQMRAVIHRLSEEGQLAGVVVDYLQLMTGDPRLSKVAQVTEISRELKLIARDFQLPVIALSQLNRNSEGRADKRPALADLRESGSIEQDADVVMLLHRDTQDDTGQLDVIVAKNRQGPTGTVTLTWQGEFMRAVA